MKRLIIILAMVFCLGMISCAGKPVIIVLDGSNVTYPVDYLQTTEDVDPATLGT